MTPAELQQARLDEARRIADETGQSRRTVIWQEAYAIAFNRLTTEGWIPSPVDEAEYLTVALSKNGVVTIHHSFDENWDEMVSATNIIVAALQDRLNRRGECPYARIDYDPKPETEVDEAEKAWNDAWEVCHFPGAPAKAIAIIRAYGECCRAEGAVPEDVKAAWDTRRLCDDDMALKIGGASYAIINAFINGSTAK